MITAGVTALFVASVGLLVPVGPARGSTGTSIVAGSGKRGSSGDGGPAVEAGLNSPLGVAVTSGGAVYISDTGGHRVRKVARNGTISTVAGTGSMGHREDRPPVNQSASKVALSAPAALALGGDGTLYIADPRMHRVYRMSADERLSVLAGDGSNVSSGDGGPAIRAGLDQVSSLAVAADGTVYIADTGSHVVRAVSSSGTITTIAGDGGSQLTAAGGAARHFSLPYPTGLAVDRHGRVWVADQVLVRLDDGQASTVVVADQRGGRRSGSWRLSKDPTSGPQSPGLYNVQSVAVGQYGTVYVAEERSDTVVQLASNHQMQAVADLSRFAPLIGQLAVAPSGDIYLVDSEHNRVIKFRPSRPQRTVTTQAAPISWWPFVTVLGTLLLVVVVALILVKRRRRVSRESIS